MTVVAGKSRVNRPFFFREVGGTRMEVPAFDRGQGDLEGSELALFRMYERAEQIEPSSVVVSPSNVSVPTVSGSAVSGETLSGNDGEWEGQPEPALSRQWMADGVAISGATGVDYTLTDAEIGSTITLEVTATNSGGSASATSDPTAVVEPADSAPVNTSAPVLSGTPEVGQELTVTNGQWDGHPAPTFSRQWLADGTAIAGATGTSYTLTAGEAGANITVEVTGTNSSGSSTAASNEVGPVTEAPSFTVDPVLSGTPTVGETLTVTNGTAGGTPAATFARAWLRDGTEIAGATGTTLVLTEDDVDSLISVRVTATNSAGSDVAISNELGPVVAAEP